MNTSRDVRLLLPLTKAGELGLMRVYPWDDPGRIEHQFQSNSRLGSSKETDRRNLCDAFEPHETRHSFAIEALPKPGRLKSRPYLYTCVRCKWRFRLNDRFGSIVTLDGNGQPLSEPENSERAATFASGPCPAFGRGARRRTTKVRSIGWFARMRSRLSRRLEAMWRRWRGEADRRTPIDPNATTMIMAEDLLR
jgi:hypothetical protein